MSNDSNPPTIRVGEDQKVQMSLKLLATVIATVAVAVAGWISLKAEAAEHGRKIQSIESVQSIDHDILTDMRATQKAQYDQLRYLVNGRRGNPPDEGANPPR